MPGKRWTKQEKAELRRQIKTGVRVDDVKITGRTKAGINYKFCDLKLSRERWRDKQLDLLRKKAREGNPPSKIEIPGKSKFAIRNKMLRMGLLKPKPHHQRPWLRSELDRLQHLVQDCGYTARRTITNGYFSDRSIDSVAQQMRRNKWKRMRKE